MDVVAAAVVVMPVVVVMLVVAVSSGLELRSSVADVERVAIL